MNRFLPLLAFAFSLTTPAMSAANTPDICAAAAITAEKRYGLPDGLLRAISIVETSKDAGENRSAWPWTVNLKGRGYWFDNRAAAMRFVNASMHRGEKSMDLGCFQINTKWHGKEFSGARAMFNPSVSADYAAQFLTRLKKQTGNWSSAAAAYHSKDVKRGAAYLKKVTLARSQLRKTPRYVVADAQQRVQPVRRAQTPGNAPALRGATPLATLTNHPVEKNRQRAQSAGVALTMFQDRPPLINTAAPSESLLRR